MPIMDILIERHFAEKYSNFNDHLLIIQLNSI